MTEREHANKSPAQEIVIFNQLNLFDLIFILSLRRNLFSPFITKMCEELNNLYVRANYIASALLIRSIINHVPPIFWESDFNNVGAQSGRSIKAVLKRLNEEARPVADLHAHFMIRKKESLPSNTQLKPYKLGFEVLLHEVITRASTKKYLINLGELYTVG